MNHVEHLLTLMATAEGEQAVLDWLTNPVTQTMLGIARDHIVPSGTITASQSEHSYRLGWLVGGREVVDLMANPLRIKQAQQGPELIPDYGSGYNDDSIGGV